MKINENEIKQTLKMTQHQESNEDDDWKKYEYQLRKRLKILIKWASKRYINQSEFLYILQEVMSDNK